MRLLLIRHGDPDYVHDDLTGTGKKEAALLAERIAPMHVREYFVSPLGTKSPVTHTATLVSGAITAEKTLSAGAMPTRRLSGRDEKKSFGMNSLT